MPRWCRWLGWLAFVSACNERPRESARDSGSKAGAALPRASASIEQAEASEGGSSELVILVGGDVNLGRDAGQQILRNPEYNPFSELEPLLKSADLRFVNLESQLSEQRGETQSPRNHLVFTGPPGGAHTLALGHIDVVSLANNHAWDYGKAALFETLTNLRRANVSYVGASEARKAQYEPLTLRVRGKRVAIFAVTQVWNQPPFNTHEGQFYVAWASIELLKENIARARRENDIVILSYHGGGEYVEVPMQWTRVFVRDAMQLGVDVIVGHHPHVPHGIGWIEGRPVLYSLGNLVFAMHSDYPWTGTSFMARLTFGSGPVRVEACPYFILGHQPQLFSGATKSFRDRAMRRHLQEVSLSVGGSRVSEPGALGCMTLSPPDARGIARGAAQ
jgi:poly-gamma-glutamate synthesis protein (capsule biosynthesis protein)